LTSLIRKISQTVSALAILSLLSTSIASADQALTVAATTPATTASETSPVAPDANNDVAQAGPLSDVPLNSWAYDAVNQLAKDGIIKGYPDGTFKGKRPMTRYEAAVLAYRAVDMLEAQITAGKAVEKADMDAANKLMAAFGNELKAVERHVDALQKQADTLGTTVDAQGKKLDATTALGAATAATVRRAQFHMSTIFRSFAFGQNVTANAGPLPETFNGVVYGPGAALPTGIGTAPTGTGVAGSATTTGGVVAPGAGAVGGLQWGPNPTYNGNPNSATTGPYNHGLGYEGITISLSGNPDDRSQYLVSLHQTDRYSAANFYPAQTPGVCQAATIGIGAAAAPCSGANSAVLSSDGILNNFLRMQNAWYQYTSPGGVYVKVGKFAQDEGPKQVRDTSWGLADYVNGARIGYRNDRFNAQIGYGYEDTAAQQNTLYGLPFSSQTMWAQADYQLDKKGHTDVGGYYSNYSGYHQTLWDASAVMCLGTGLPVTVNGVTTTTPRSTSKVIPLLANQTFTSGGCGAGFAPIVYGAPGASAGLPITGAYIATGAGAQSPHASILGGFIVGNYGQLRIAVDGMIRLGNDPTTGTRWLGNTSGYAQLDYGAYLPHPGVKNQFGLEMVAFAAGMNGLGPGTNFYQGPNWYTSFGSNYSDYYTVMLGVRRFITDTASVGVFYAHQGILPNTTIPAGSPQCPGCVITGDSRNAVWGEVNMAF
jgi:hypothetical protein